MDCFFLFSILTIATLAQKETDEIFWPARGTCSLNTGDVGLVDGGLQRREGCRRARGTPYILGGKNSYAGAYVVYT